MKPSLKNIIILGLATGLGNMILDQSKDDQVKWRAIKLSEAGQAAIDNCPYKVDKSIMRRARIKIDEIKKDREEYDITEMLSFLILGIQDLQHHCHPSTYLDTLEKRAIWFCKLFDPGLEMEETHATAYANYEAWIGC